MLEVLYARFHPQVDCSRCHYGRLPYGNLSKPLTLAAILSNFFDDAVAAFTSRPRCPTSGQPSDATRSQQPRCSTLCSLTAARSSPPDTCTPSQRHLHRCTMQRVSVRLICQAFLQCPGKPGSNVRGNRLISTRMCHISFRADFALKAVVANNACRTSVRQRPNEVASVEHTALQRRCWFCRCMCACCSSCCSSRPHEHFVSSHHRQ